MIVITGATGQLGRLVLQELLAQIPASQIAVAVRTPAKAQDLAALGVQIREADYDNPETLVRSFQGAEKVLLISSSEVGRRFTQHKAAIDAAKQAGVRFLAYTSILHADTSPLPLAQEHLETERYLAGSQLPHALLRNGWYTENYTAGVPAALQLGALYGSAGQGRIASAARIDFASAAARVMLLEDQAGKVYELAGDTAYTLAEFAAELSRLSGKAIPYRDLPEAHYQSALLQAGLPAPIATLLAESDTGASKGGLLDESHTLSQLIGRPTTHFTESLEAALKN